MITNQLKNEDENTKISNDWKFAAMVIDRMCLIIFTLFTIIATITVLLSAPHIIVTWFRKASLPPVVPGPTRIACRTPASTDAARDALIERPPLTDFRQIGLKGVHLRIRTPLRFGDLRVRKKAIRGVTSFLYDTYNNTSKNKNNNIIDNENNDNSVNNNYVIVTIKFYHIIIPRGRLSEIRWHTVYKWREHTRGSKGHAGIQYTRRTCTLVCYKHPWEQSMWRTLCTDEMEHFIANELNN